MSYVPEKNCVPATKAGACTQTFRFDYKGEDYYVTYDANVNGKNFLGIPEIKYRRGIGWGQTLNPKQPGAADGEFEILIKTTEFQTAWSNEISAFKGQIQKDGRTEQAKKALQTTAQQNIWDGSNAGNGYSQPNPNPGNPPTTTVAPPVSGGPVAIPEEIKKLQDTADATIASLFDPNDPEDALQIITYPKDAYYENSQDCVYIEQFEYRAPQADVFAKNNQLNPPGLIPSIQAGLSRKSNLKKSIGAVRLPIPNQLSISNGVSWADDRANALEAGAFFSALGVASNSLNGNITEAVGKVLTGVGDLGKFIGSGGFSNTPAGILLSSFLAQAALGKIGLNVDPGQFLARATGTTINPNLELLFNGPKLRNFSFAFEFAPNDDEDARASRRVIRFFRQGMAPKKNNANLIFIGSPNVFRITYKNGDRRIKGLNAFKICALTACEVNFTPEGVYQSYDDERAVSQPVRTTMTLSFTELTPIFERDYFDDTDPSVQDALGGIAGDKFARDDIGF